MGKKKVHHKILAKLNDIAGVEDKKYFTPVIDSFTKGLEDPANYNRAVRNLCNSTHAKVIPMLEEILPSRLLLGISLTEINKDGLSAMNIAEKKNPEAFALLKEHNQEELNNILNESLSELTQNMYGTSVDSKSPLFFQPSNGTSTLSKEQNQKIKDTAKITADTLHSELPRLTNPHTLPAEEAKKVVDGFTANLLGNLGVKMPVNQSKTAASFEVIGDELEAMSAKNPPFEAFLRYCKQGQYEAALRSLSSTPDKDHQKGAQLAEHLFKYKEQLGLNLSKMVNKEQQSPLHQAAIDSNWPLYYTLAGPVCGGNSYITDSHGKSAQDYRRERQYGFMGQTGQNPLNSLFDGNISANPNPGCAQQ